MKKTNIKYNYQNDSSDRKIGRWNFIIISEEYETKEEMLKDLQEILMPIIKDGLLNKFLSKESMESIKNKHEK